MDITEAITSRRSIRAYKPNPIPQAILQEILKAAIWAPSWTNSQPWEFAVATGSKLAEIRKGYLDRIDKAINPDIAAPVFFPEPYDSRRKTAIGQSHEAGKIRRGNQEDKISWERQQLTGFGAPCEIYICTHRDIYFQKDGVNSWSMFDCGMVAQNIMLLATKYGLGTIPQARAVVHPDIIRKTLEIPDSKLIVVGLAIGYPDWEHSLNKYRTARELLDAVAKWHGF
jgi:nitroreductase